jgi:uncharacterized protein YutE (UPF0331/DUF86 family)
VTPSALDWRTITAKLMMIQELLVDLAELGPFDVRRMDGDRLAKHAVERILALIVDLAVDINNHVTAVELRRAADSYKESFPLAAQAGLISDDLARALMPSAGMRNVLVHDYLEVKPERVAAAVPLAIEQYGRYIDQVREWALKRTPAG